MGASYWETCTRVEHVDVELEKYVKLRYLHHMYRETLHIMATNIGARVHKAEDSLRHNLIMVSLPCLLQYVVFPEAIGHYQSRGYRTGWITFVNHG